VAIPAAGWFSRGMGIGWFPRGMSILAGSPRLAQGRKTAEHLGSPLLPGGVYNRPRTLFRTAEHNRDRGTGCERWI